MMRVGGLFSGIGGMELGLQRAGMRIAWMCEIDQFCRRVLAKHWPDVPVYQDVRELTADAVEPVDLISGGFPCQPWSVAGEQRGADDERDLWPAMRAVVAVCRPRWVLGENVPGIVPHAMGLDRVLADLGDLGYASQAFGIPACAVDAPHRRERVWIVANATGERRSDRHARARQRRAEPERPSRESQRLCSSELADSIGAGLEVGAGEPGHDGAQRQAAQRSGGLGDAERAKRRVQAEGRYVVNGHDAGRDQAPSRAAQSSRVGHWHDAEWLRCEFDGKARRVPEPRFLRVPDGLPRRLDGGLSHGATKIARPGEILPSVRKTPGSQDLQFVAGGQREVCSEEVLRSDVHGVAHGQGRSEARNATYEGEGSQTTILPALWSDQEPACSPRRHQSGQQRPAEPGDVMRLLSSEAALARAWANGWPAAISLQDMQHACEGFGPVPQALSEVQEVWRSLDDQDRGQVAARLARVLTVDQIPLLTKSAPGRVARLRALGNAVVPQVVEQIGRAIMRAAA